MKKILIAIAIAIIGCDNNHNSGKVNVKYPTGLSVVDSFEFVEDDFQFKIIVIHDNKRNNTCYFNMWGQRSISCVKDIPEAKDK